MSAVIDRAAYLHAFAEREFRCYLRSVAARESRRYPGLLEPAAVLATFDRYLSAARSPMTGAEYYALRRPFVAALLVLFLALPALAAPKPTVPHRVHFLSAITVKVVADEDFAKRAAQDKPKVDPYPTREGRPARWILTSVDQDSCTAWVPMRRAGTAEVEAFRACREALDRKVDAAHAAAEARKGGVQ